VKQRGLNIKQHISLKKAPVKPQTS
jgi:hypothetical protein